MKKSVWLLLGVMVAVVSIVIFLRPSDDALSKPSLVEQIKPTSNLETAQKSKLIAAVVKEQVEPEDEFNPYESAVFKAQIQQVADLYEDSSKYPVGSRPIRNPNDVKEPAPFEFNEVDLPFTGDDVENPLRILAATNTYQYYQGDVIEVRVQISGAPSDTFIEVVGKLSSAKGDIPLPLVFQPTGESLSQFTAQLDSSLIPSALTSPEMSAVINVKIGRDTLLTTVAFRYDLPSAQVVGTLPARVEGPNLVIPVQVNVGQTGYYFLRAVLEDAASRLPLIELQSEGRMASGNGLLNLNAHITALRFHQSEGPYILRSVKLHRAAEQGELFDIPASTLEAEFQIQGFPFSNYEDEEYVDELAQERLAFLRELGSVDEEQVREDVNATLEDEVDVE